MKRIFSSAILLCMAIILMAQDVELRENKEFKGLGKLVLQAGFSPFGNYFAYTIGDNTLRIFDKDWKKIFEHQGNPESGGGVFAFSPDGEYLAYSMYKGNTDLAIIRLSDLKVMQVLDEHDFIINHLEYSHDGQYLSSSGHSSELILWERKGELFSMKAKIESFESYVYESSFSYDDRFLIAGDSYGNIKVLEDRDGEFKMIQEMSFRRHSCKSICFHPKEYTFVTGSSNGLRRYKLANGEYFLTDSLEKRSSTNHHVDFSPQGNYLAVPSRTEIKIYEMKSDTMELVFSNRRHTASTLGTAFSEDGKFLSSCAVDEKVIIWEVDNISASDKALVSGWIIGNLTLAQRRSLTPEVCRKIISSTKQSLSAPRDEFEKTIAYNERRELLSDHTIKILQAEMEKIYLVKNSDKSISFPLTELIAYNADQEIYKIKMIDTEAGVRIPVEDAKKLKASWEKARIKVDKVKKSGRQSYSYENFRLIHPVSKKEYEVTPLENPFEQNMPGKSLARVGTMTQSKKLVTDTVNGNTYALLFATNVYDYFGDLVNPILDAQTISTELSENYNVVSEVVINATLEETAAKIYEFASREYGEKDNLLVFFAGHGIYDKVFREGYVISRDSKNDDFGKTTYMSHSNLRTMINNINCPHIFLVMDVCFGGTFDPHLASSHRGASQYAEVSIDKFIERKQKYTTRLYLTSGGNEYVPDGRPGFHSPFARKFIESLRYYGGDDGVLTTAEILPFVEKVNPQPRFGEFGDNEPGSDFILILDKEV